MTKQCKWEPEYQHKTDPLNNIRAYLLNIYLNRKLLQLLRQVSMFRIQWTSKGREFQS